MARHSRRPRIVTAVGASGVGVIQELVADATRDSTPLRVVGHSNWIDAGRPVAATRIASTAAHAGVVDYVPGDLTITVMSGTTLREIEEITRGEGQWLPLDPFGSSDGTIGATISTGSFGPLANGFGRARDLVLGVEFVTGQAKIVRGGGKVVKNVAGYDLVRLVTGSWGTLGIITEVTLRLYALPQESMTFCLGIPDGAGALRNRIASVLSIPGNSFAVEVVNAAVAETIGLSAEPQVMIRIGGNSATVAAQRTSIAALGGAHVVRHEAWDKLRTIEHDRTVVIRLSALPSRVADLWINARNAVREIPGAMMHSTPSLGVVRCVLPSSVSSNAIESLLQSSRGASAVFERLSPAEWERFSPGVTSDRISQGIKKAFDPLNILNPGILGPVA